MKNEKVIKGIGLAATIGGFVISLISSWVADKNLDAKVSEKVTQALAAKSEKTGS